MSKTARITIDLALPEGTEITQRVQDALSDLADVMLVQAEDGLYTTGWPDNPDAEHVLDWGLYGNTERRNYTSSVSFVDIDTESSVSRQHFIDTGIYLTREETS